MKKNKRTKVKKKNTFFEGEDAKIISRFLRVSFPNGSLTAQEVLDLARPSSSPIHKYFEWDNTIAAEKYRLSQARHLITCVVVEIDEITVRKYVTPVVIHQEGRRAYVEINRARADKNIWVQVLERAMQDALMWNARYKHLRQLKSISVAITEAEKSLKQNGVLHA